MYEHTLLDYAEYDDACIYVADAMYFRIFTFNTTILVRVR